MQHYPNFKVEYRKEEFLEFQEFYGYVYIVLKTYRGHVDGGLGL